MRIQAIFKRIMLQRKGDKRTLALLFIAPLIILGLLYLLLQVPSNQTYRIGFFNSNTQLASEMKNELKTDENLKIIFINADKTQSQRQIINDKSLDALISFETNNKISITYANRNTGTTQAIGSQITQIIQKKEDNKLQDQLEALIHQLPKSIQTQKNKLSNLTIKTHFLYGDSTLNLFINLAPVLVAFFVFFFVFLISGISLVNERTSGTLQRMLVSPIKRNDIVAGYTLAYGLIAVIQTILVLLWVHFVLGMQVVGNFIWVIIINFLIALIALLIGLVLSAYSKTEFQFVQFIPVALVPQFLFSGIINVDTMAQPLQWLAHVMPLYYGVDALQKIIKQGMTFSQIGLDLAVLIGFALLLYFLNVHALKNVRRT